jgi:signal transduction histidine kinase
MVSQVETIKEEKFRIQSNLANITSYNNHLTNIIRGINHEVSPWLGSIGNIVSIAKEDYMRNMSRAGKTITNADLEMIKYFDEAKKAAKQAADVLVLTSKNMKKLRNWSTTKSNIKDTVNSWCYIALMEHDIKGRINESNLKVDQKSLNFEVLHSPMLVSQIILNLVKNAIDHNENMLDDLVIKIYGDGDKTIYIEDNGKGIERNIINNIFKPGVSTKQDSNLPSGLGLASTVDYCMLMGAMIKVESRVNKYTRFHITFKKDGTELINNGESIDRRSAYYEIITEPTKEPVAKKHSIVPHTTYNRTPSCESIEIDPERQGSEFRRRIAVIDETLQKLK